MYRIYFINFQYYCQDEFESIDDAKRKVRSAGFEARIEDSHGNMIAFWSPMGGWK